MQPLPLVSIGTVSSSVTTQSDEAWGRTSARIILHPQYHGALLGLEDFSHAIILTYLHQARFDAAQHLRRRPRGREDMPLLGIFAQRAKDRPNPIGVTSVAILSVHDDYLEVRGLDAIDGTPVLDIKPYFPDYDRIADPRVPAWVAVLMQDYF